MRLLKTMLVLFLLLPGATTWASDGEWFAALKVSLGEATMSDISHGGTIGTGVVIGGEIDGKIKDDQIDDYTAGLGFAVGRRFGNWALEAEYVYRYRTDWDVVAPTPSIQTITNVFANVESHTLLVNLIRRGVISQFWSWEVGAGAGLVSNAIEAEYLERATNVTAEQSFKDNSDKTEFSYNIIAGVTREWRRDWTFNIRYRYIDLGELQAGPFPGRAARLQGDHASHEIQFALERSF